MDGGRVSIACDWAKTRQAFKHTASVLINGRSVEDVKICYQNRTWEAYEYQSVLYKAVESSKCLTKEEKEAWTSYIKNYGNIHRDSNFSSIAMIATMADIFTDNKKEANDWKARMLKAGLESYGLIMPDDWEELSEDEKQTRLNKVINELAKA